MEQYLTLELTMVTYGHVSLLQVVYLQCCGQLSHMIYVAILWSMCAV